MGSDCGKPVASTFYTSTSIFEKFYSILGTIENEVDFETYLIILKDVMHKQKLPLKGIFFCLLLLSYFSTSCFINFQKN